MCACLHAKVHACEQRERMRKLDLSLMRISWLRKRGWKLSASTPLFQRRILLATKKSKKTSVAIEGGNK